jgi:hypothetical protein
MLTLPTWLTLCARPHALTPPTLQLKLSHSAVEVRSALAAQQRDAALAAVQELEGQLEQIGADIASHMKVWAAAASRCVCVSPPRLHAHTHARHRGATSACV